MNTVKDYMKLCVLYETGSFEVAIDNNTIGEKRFLKFARIMGVPIDMSEYTIDFSEPIKITKAMKSDIENWCKDCAAFGSFEQTPALFAEIRNNSFFYVSPYGYFTRAQEEYIKKSLALLNSGIPFSEVNERLDSMQGAASVRKQLDKKVWNIDSRISSNYLYHFTKKMEYLESILQNGFYPRVCMEDASFLMHNYDRPQIGYPIVCFCDLPPTLIDDHKAKYGHYGISMTKDWGIKNGINPVMYIASNDALFIKNFRKFQFDVLTVKRLNDIKGGKAPVEKELMEAFVRVIQMSAFLRQYKDEEYSIPFYDDREWRYLYTDDSIPIDKYFSDLLYIPEVSGAYFDQEIVNKDLESHPLLFDASDVNAIYVKTQEERGRMLRILSGIPRFSTLDKGDLESLVIAEESNDE